MHRVISWLAVALNLTGALFVAYNLRPIGYLLFIVGALIFVFIEYRNKNCPQVALNGAYLFINILGFYHAFKN